jgi:hypothetical protein
VRDTSGAVLPGVTVEAASPALIEKVRSSVTDASGAYRLEDLRVGTYSVTYTLPGFSTLRRDAIELNSGFTATLNVELRVGGLEETITVTGESPVVDVTTARRQMTLENDTIRSVPNTRNYNSLLVMVPGVSTDRNDVATGPLISVFPMHGGRGSDNRVQVDGLTIGNAPGGNQGSHYVADVGNAAEVTMTAAGGGLGESETAGLIMNIVPRAGGNVFSGLGYYSGTGENLQADNTPEGAAAPTKLQRVYDLNGSIGGPIRRDKVWFFFSARTQGQRRNTANLFFNRNAGDPTSWTYDPDFDRPAYSDKTWENAALRVTTQINAKNKIAVFWDEQAICRKCTGATSFSGSPVPNISPEAEGYGEYRPQRVQQARWTSPITNRLLLEAAGGTSYYQWGNGERPDNQTRDLVRVVENNAQRITRADGSTYLTPSNLTYRSMNYNDDSTNAITWNASGSWVGGRSSIKVGYQGSYFIDDRLTYTNSTGLIYTLSNGVPISLQQLSTPHESLTRAAQTSFFVQEQYTLNRLTLQGALRYDSPRSWYPEQRVGGTRFLPQVIEFPETDGVTGYHDITPRVGAAYDVFGNGKTAIKGNIGKYLESASSGGAGVYGSVNPTLRLASGVGGGGITPPGVSRNWTDANNNFVPDCDLLNPNAQSPATTGSIDTCGTINNLAFGTNTFTTTYDPELFSGWGVRASDWSAGLSVQQEIFPRASVEVAYVRRWFSGFQATDNRAYAASDYETFAITVPDDSRFPNAGQTITGLYGLKPGVPFGRVDNYIQLAENIGERTQYANNIDVTLNIRTSNGLTMQGGYSTTNLVNDTCEIRAALPESAELNPFCHTETGFRPQFRALAAYTIPRVDVQVSGVWQDKPGASLNANITVFTAGSTTDPTNTNALIGGYRYNTSTSRNINVLEPNTLFGDRIRELDFKVAKIMNFAGKRLTAGVDIYNALNNNVTLTYNQTYGLSEAQRAAYLNPTSWMSPRMLRFTVEFAY